MSPLRALIRRQFAEQRGAFVLGLSVALVPAITGLLLLGVAGWFITASAVAGAAGLLINYFTPSALIRGLAIGRTAGRYGERMLTHDATFRFLARLRGAVFAGFAASRPATAGQSRSGLRLARLTLDIDQLDRAYLRLVVPAFVTGVVTLLAGAAAVLMAPLALVPLASGLLLVAVAAGLLSQRKLAQAARRMEAAEEAMRLRSADFVAGRRDLAIYGGLDEAVDGIRQAGLRRSEAERPLERSASLAEALVMSAGQLLVALGLVLLAPQVAGGILSAALVTGLLLVGLGMTETLASLLPGLAGWTRTQRAAARVMPLAERGASPVASSDQPGIEDMDDSAPALELRGVAFAYPGAQRPVLEGFNLTLARGETVCLIGPSGCGKSTVLALAARLVRPDAGAIRLGGRDLSEIPEAVLRQRLAVISQKPVLFNDTIAANLRLAVPEASPEAMWAALEAVGLADTIAARPEGLGSLIGEGGAGLSGGEARRLALARALLMRPDIVLLDEVTEGLDDATAAGVLGALSAFGESGASLLLISHRARELAIADRIVPLAEPATA
ncbi:thiol reductant ABC exporter subunit CydC [Pannonibacter sp.]|uniref:thiol reductant ABC exporter subunit CydC n=1 Tax=Pannonibacter sp. TaxID=1906786 RepID=UPI003F6F2A55